MEFGFDDATTPQQAIFQALGAASVCWESLDNSGIFESDRAKEIGLALITKLVSHGLELGEEPWS